MEETMHQVVYPNKKTFSKYDEKNIIGYLNEEIIPDYVPQTMEGQPAPEPTTGYQYSGKEKDGGTIMPCSDAESYPEVANAIIRSKFSISDEMAIHRHHANNPEEYAEEWRGYNEFCESAEQLAKQWLGIG